MTRVIAKVALAVLTMSNCPACSGGDSAPSARGPTVVAGGATLGTEATDTSAKVPRRPVEIAPARCAGPSCNRRQQVETAVNRAATWLAAFPKEQLRFDAAVGLSQLRRIVDSPVLREAFARAREVADRDDDHPHRRFWIPDFALPAEATSRWTVPDSAERRANTNRPVDEALYCRENGWRAETMRYICGPMRDHGGYYSVHALWALAIAAGNGCVAQSESETCMRSLQAELAAAQPDALVPGKTLDIDLYAERLCMLAMTGWLDQRLHRWARTLLRLQSADGSWGVAAASEDPYYRYHATMMATWALAEWYRLVAEHPELGK